MRGELGDGLSNPQEHTSGAVMVAPLDQLLYQHIRVE